MRCYINGESVAGSMDYSLDSVRNKTYKTMTREDFLDYNPGLGEIIVVEDEIYIGREKLKTDDRFYEAQNDFKLKEYRCKNCGAILDVGKHRLVVKCDYCGSVFTKIGLE